MAFIYFESLWKLGPEPKEQRIIGLAEIVRGGHGVTFDDLLRLNRLLLVFLGLAR